MTKPLVDRIPFAKIATFLAAAFGVSLGLCGVTALLSSGMHGGAGGTVVIAMGMLELAVMGLSLPALAITLLAWLVLNIAARGQGRGDQPQKLFGEQDETELDEKE